MREPSLNSAVAISPRRQEVERAVRAYVRDLLSRCPEVQAVIWFGSWVTGRPSRYSDVDICLILSESPTERIRDRIPRYLPDRFPGGLDVFPYTVEEFDALRSTAPSWYRAIKAGLTFTRHPPAT